MRGYEVLLPCLTEIRRWSDRVKRVERPLFPGYLFCQIRDDVIPKIVTAPGVIRIVGNGTDAIPVAAHEIQAIRRVVTMGLSAEPWHFLQVGQRVRVEAGPLRGIEGIIVKTKNGHRLVLSVSLLQRSVAVEVDARSVRVPPGRLTELAAADASDPHRKDSLAVTASSSP